MGVNAASAFSRGRELYLSGSFEDEVQQEMLARERNARVQFGSLMVNAILAAAHVITSGAPKETFVKMQTEMTRLLNVYEAEVHQDLYRPDVQASLRERLKRQAEAAERSKRLEEAALTKLDNLTER